MEVKIVEHTGFDEALTQATALQWRVSREYLAGLPFNRRVDKLAELARSSEVQKHEASLLAVIQMTRRTFEEHTESEKKSGEGFDVTNRRRERSVAHFHEWCEALYWDLPDSCQETTYVHDQDGRYPDGTRAVEYLVEAKAVLFKELAREWRAKVCTNSLYSFHRAIAMGWPRGKDQGLLKDEHPVAEKSRGRFVSEKERKRYIKAMRDRLGHSFADFDEEKQGANNVYGSWIRQQHVPDDVLHLLYMARARAGGHEQAVDDVTFGLMLEGLPESGRAILEKEVAGPMRQMERHVLAVEEEIITRTHKRSPRFDTRYMELEHTYRGVNAVTIGMRGGGDLEMMQEVMSDACEALKVQHRKGLTGHVRVRVKPSYSSADINPLVREFSW